MTDTQILKRLYNDYTKKYLKKILLSLFFTLILAGSTSSVAYLLDPAIKQLFINQNQNLIYVIPGFIILAFATKGISLYLAKVIMIGVAEDVRKNIIEKLSYEKVYKQGFNINTPINLELQKIATDVLRKGLISYDKRKG